MKKNNRYSLLELANNQCRWCVSDIEKEGFLFCGKKTKDGAVYCPEHAKISYIKRNNNSNK